jgi:hypothetical protein
MPNSGTQKEVNGGQCGSSAQRATKVSWRQCEPDPQWPSAARLDSLCPPDDLAHKGHATVTKAYVTDDHPEEVNERPGPGPFRRFLWEQIMGNRLPELSLWDQPQPAGWATSRGCSFGSFLPASSTSEKKGSTGFLSPIALHGPPSRCTWSLLAEGDSICHHRLQVRASEDEP